MYRISRVLNHNGVIAINMENNQEYVLLGKGVGFGKKVSERFEAPEECTIYSLMETTERGNASELVKSVAPEYLEVANEILNEAAKVFGDLDRRILFPMADHIAFAVERIKNNEQISNPLTDDIKVLFYSEYKVAAKLKDILNKRLNILIDEHEIGYVALHIHSAIVDENVSVAMQMAEAVRECVSLIEEKKEEKIDIMSLAYNRLMNHVKYMVARALQGEDLKLNMNDYMEVKFPDSFSLAMTVCDHLSNNLKVQLKETEIGYLAMHIERVYSGELD